MDIAAAALADAQRIARANPRRRSAAGRRLRRENLAGRNGTDQSVTERTVTERNVGGYSGPARDLGADPHPIGELVAGYVEERGWQRPLAEARVFAEWPALVGADVAAHCVPAALRDGELRIAAESTAWATQLRLLSATLLARLVAELGADVVTKLVVTGPTAPSWRHGAFTVRGARGPRDTYG